jgi:hypothetical protein
VDGEALGHMLKVFADIDFATKKPRGPVQTQDQISRELQLFRSAGWPGDLESKVLADNDVKHRRAILGWVWQIICYDQLSRFGRNQAADNVNEIYKWVDRYLADHYADVDRGDALKGLSAFQDGKLLSYLVDRTDPSVIDLSNIKQDPVEDVTDRAIGAAAKLGVPMLVDYEDIIGAPNDKSLVTYLTAFRDTVEKQDREIYEWVDKYLAGAYPDVPPGYAQKGSDSFKDGRLLDYLVDKTNPKAINLSEQRNKQPKDRINTSVNAAKELLEFNPKLTGDDVVKGNEDKLKRYLTDFRNALRDKEESDNRARQLAEEEDRKRREAAAKSDEDERRRREEEDRRRREEEERKRREAAAKAAEDERRRREEEENRRRNEAARKAAEEEEEDRRRREAARRAAEEEEERRRREAVQGVRNIYPQRVLVVELKELETFPEFDSEPDAKQTRMYGPGLERAQVNAPATFVVETRNRQGKPVLSGGHPFKLVVDGPSPGQSPEIQSIVDNHDGTYTCKYVPKVSGFHTVRVTLHGENVAQSPVRVFAEPNEMRALVDDDLDDLRKLLEAIAREIARDRKNLDKLPKIVKKLEQLGLTNEDARDLAYEVGEDDNPRLNEFLKNLADAKDRAFGVLDNPRMTKTEIRKTLTPMIKQLVGNMDDWADDYGDVMDKIKNLRPNKKNGNQRQRVHLWIHRKGIPVPQHIMVTTNKPSTMNYRRHIRVDASQGVYDTHSKDNPAAYLDGILGLTSELKLQKIESRDRYLTGNKDEESELDLESATNADAYIVNDKGVRVLPSKEPLLLEGGLQNEKGQAVYAFLYANALAITQIVNNGEKYILRSLIKFETVTPGFQGKPTSFLVSTSRKERAFTAKSKEIAATWVSNMNAAIKAKKGAF